MTKQLTHFHLIFQTQWCGYLSFGQKNPEIWVESQMIFYETVLNVVKNSLQIEDYLLKYSSFFQ